MWDDPTAPLTKKCPNSGKNRLISEMRIAKAGKAITKVWIRFWRLLSFVEVLFLGYDFMHINKVVKKTIIIPVRNRLSGLTKLPK